MTLPLEVLETKSLSSQDLLQRLIQEGLTAKVDATPDSIKRSRKVLQLLTDSLIFKPSLQTQPATGSQLERAGYALAILRRQISALPALLRETSQEPSLGSPFYKWLIPRILSAISRFFANESSTNLAIQLLDAVVEIIHWLNKANLEPHVKLSESRRSAIKLVAQLLDYNHHLINKTDVIPLYGFRNIPRSRITAAVINSVSLRCDIECAERLKHWALRQTIVLAQRISDDRVAQNILMASYNASGLHLSSLAFYSIALTWQVQDDTRWIDAMNTILAQITGSDAQVQMKAWRVMSAHIAALPMPNEHAAQRIAFLLSPIDGLLDAKEIVQLLDDGLLRDWYEVLHVEKAADTDHVADIVESIRDHITMRANSSKAIRHHVVESSAFSEWLPLLALEEVEEVVPRLSAAIQRSVIDILNTEGRLVLMQQRDGINRDSLPGLVKRLTPVFLAALQPSGRHDSWTKCFNLWELLASRWPGPTATLPLLVASSKIEQFDVPPSSLFGDFVRAYIFKALSSPDRRCRIGVGSVLSRIFRLSTNVLGHKKGSSWRLAIIDEMEQIIVRQSVSLETVIATLGQLGRLGDLATLERVLKILLKELGSPHTTSRSIAFTELLALARHTDKSPYSLVSPFMDSISIVLVKSLARQPEIFTESVSFLGQTRQNFVETTLKHTVPALVIERDRQILDVLASYVNRSLGMILIEHTQLVLTKIFLNPETDRTLTYFVTLLRQLMQDGDKSNISASSMITSCIVPFSVSLIVELGNESDAIASRAADALYRLQGFQHGGVEKDLGTVLKPHMLGIMTHLNETLHDIQGKKSVKEKQKMLRSLGKLVEMIGASIASYSPQIIATLQSALQLSDLRHETLLTWKAFVHTMRYADLGPFVGRTTGAIVANWQHFEPIERKIAIAIVSEIASNSANLMEYVDEVVNMDHIKELKTAGEQLTSTRRSWSFRTRLQKLAEQVSRQNVAVATSAVRELRNFLLANQHELASLSQGDTFDPLTGDLIKAVLQTSRRGMDDHLRRLSLECLGIIGALDPDRLDIKVEVTTMTIVSNFNEPDESVDFAIHLIRDLLVDAYRATNDTKLQTHIAFAIQELLKFCGFSQKVLQSSNASMPLKTRSRWSMFPKDQHETLTPLLESRYTLTDAVPQICPLPIYPKTSTYREWVQLWTSHLLGIVMAQPPHSKAVRDSQSIFGVFRGVLRNQDVNVAHHLLPHLVLAVLHCRDPELGTEVGNEINAILHDLVNLSGPIDKRSLSAHVAFELMDHLSKWLRLQRTENSRSERNEQMKIVEGVLNSFDVELVAHAALQSGAHARSLRNFEQRISSLRRVHRTDADLQNYFENLHQIYADLDEPDGMEGVSNFVISPSLQHQIREHESTGRWTSAQSCWEVRLQQSPEDVNLHLGLLRCLKNLGHYDTLRTHIRGILSRRPEWSTTLAPFAAEAAWISGDWSSTSTTSIINSPHGRVLQAMHEGLDPTSALEEARTAAGTAIANAQYSRAYGSISELHILRDLEMIHETSSVIQNSNAILNKDRIDGNSLVTLVRNLDHRLETTSPSFHTRDALLAIHRAAFALVPVTMMQNQVGETWLQSSKIARKAGYEQTAYSATLQAKEADASLAFMERAKLLRPNAGPWKALMDLDNSLQPLIRMRRDKGREMDAIADVALAKAVLLGARWANESDRFTRNDILERYRQAIDLAPSLESPYYHLGHYYDSMVGDSAETKASFMFHTCQNYVYALQHGVKYIYQTMPRMLTLWLDLGEHKDLKKNQELASWLQKITTLMDRARKDLVPYQFFTAFAQITSRIGHPHRDVVAVLRKIMALMISRYPQQSLWSTVGVMQSNRPDRTAACESVLHRATQQSDAVVLQFVKEAKRFAGLLLRLADDKPGDDPDGKRRQFSLAKDFQFLRSAGPSSMIIPLQSALTSVLPSTVETLRSHDPFPEKAVEIQSIDDRIDVMPSLQRPKKITFIGTDGRRYPFLCKPHDDLRKDARLMDFNSMINKLLRSASESRRRQLYIRTYAVTPLNEDCGLLEWVSNTSALKNILEELYSSSGRRLYTNDLHNALEQSRKSGEAAQIRSFKERIIPMFSPSVFVDWFILTWPEPSAWLSSRMAYSRTLAVMSMIGYVLGLGDRHGENILFDGLTGDTVHVDLNCLFEKGKLFDIPERVPFRLTHNMVDALGVTGVEGVFRRAAEISMEVLRSNSEALMSVLEAFAHDPLVEWAARPGRSKSDKDVRASADRNLKPIRGKLNGMMDNAVSAGSISNQVEALIKQATSIKNLALMYQGWAAWL